mgnify:CR=1 FL=1
MLFCLLLFISIQAKDLSVLKTNISKNSFEKEEIPYPLNRYSQNRISQKQRIELDSLVLKGIFAENRNYGEPIKPHEQINYKDIANYVAEEFEKHGYYYRKINYDAYSAQYLIEELSALGWSKNGCLERTQQGFKTLSIPMQTFEAYLKSKKHCYLNNPVTKWMLTNIEMVCDRNGNMMPQKAGNARVNKIDGPATIINGYVSFCDNVSVYLGDDN